MITIIIFNTKFKLIGKFTVEKHNKIESVIVKLNKLKSKKPLEQYLIFRNEELDPEKTFAEYNICNNITLFYTKDKSDFNY